MSQGKKLNKKLKKYINPQIKTQLQYNTYHLAHGNSGVNIPPSSIFRIVLNKINIVMSVYFWYSIKNFI